jgi:hypothetical protein
MELVNTYKPTSQSGTKDDSIIETITTNHSFKDGVLSVKLFRKFEKKEHTDSGNRIQNLNFISINEYNFSNTLVDLLTENNITGNTYDFIISDHTILTDYLDDNKYFNVYFIDDVANISFYIMIGQKILKCIIKCTQMHIDNNKTLRDENMKLKSQLIKYKQFSEGFKFNQDSYPSNTQINAQIHKYMKYLQETHKSIYLDYINKMIEDEFIVFETELPLYEFGRTSCNGPNVIIITISNYGRILYIKLEECQDTEVKYESLNFWIPCEFIFILDDLLNKTLSIIGRDAYGNAIEHFKNISSALKMMKEYITNRNLCYIKN